MDNKIKILTGSDRVRLRPAVIYGSDGVEGVQTLVEELLHIFFTEARLGYCKTIRLQQNGPELTISGNDRGLYLENGHWESLFCDMAVQNAYADQKASYTFSLDKMRHGELFGQPGAESEPGYFLELYAAQCASRQMDVQVVRDGSKYSLHFEKGCNYGGLTQQPCDGEQGTCFRFVPDAEVFTETAVPEKWLQQQLMHYAMLVPGLECVYEGQAQARYFFPEGIKSWVQEKTGAPVYYCKLSATGQDRYNRPEYEACVELAVGFSEQATDLICLHNGRQLTQGGTHVQQLEDQLCRIISMFGNRRFDTKLLHKHVTVALVTQCPMDCSCWENGTRRSIKNIMITDMTQDAAKNLTDFLYDHMEQLMPLLGRFGGNP